jgi:hypothetical protein
VEVNKVTKTVTSTTHGEVPYKLLVAAAEVAVKKVTKTKTGTITRDNDVPLKQLVAALEVEDDYFGPCLFHQSPLVFLMYQPTMMATRTTKTVKKWYLNL